MQLAGIALALGVLYVVCVEVVDVHIQCLAQLHVLPAEDMDFCLASLVVVMV